MDLDGINVSLKDIIKSDNDKIIDQSYILDSNNLDEPVILEINDEPDKEFSFKLPNLPGSDKINDDDILHLVKVDEDDDEEEIEVQSDPWGWKHDEFIGWLKEKMKNIPRHSGKDTTGIERAIAYLQRLDKEISKCVRSDFDNKVEIDILEKIRDEIHEGIERLEARHKKLMTSKRPRKKSAGLVKEATVNITGISVTVPLFISAIVRTCINAMVSSGKDIEDCFAKLAKKYDLDKRETLEAVQLFSDMNVAFRCDFGKIGEEMDPTSEENFLSPQYPA